MAETMTMPAENHCHRRLCAASYRRANENKWETIGCVCMCALWPRLWENGVVFGEERG